MKSAGRMPIYEFSTDSVSGFAECWRSVLAPLRGQAGVRMLEIGSFEGRSALWFLENILTGSGSGITCVDGFWPPYGEVFERNIARSPFSDRVIQLRGDSQAVLPGLPQEAFDIVYIDGGHLEQEVQADALEAWRVAKFGAILIFDDFLWALHLPLEQRPQRAIHRFLQSHAQDCRVLYRGYQVIVQKLRSEALLPERV